MTKLTDGKRTVGITMAIWTGSGYTPDWSNDFFDVGCLPMTDDGVYVVQDVAFCIGEAEDWKNQRGDYYCETEDDSLSVDDRYVDVMEL